MGGGSGASSGKVAYPAYVETVHSMLINHSGLDAITSSMVDIMNVALAGNPYTTMVPYDPSTSLTAIDAGVTDFDTLLATILAAVPDELTDVEINAEVDAYRDQADAELLATVIPRFQAGMRDIGAVISSAFTEGQAIIEDGQARDVNKFAADLRLKATATALERYSAFAKSGELQSLLSKMVMEAGKVRIDSEKVELDQEYSFDIGDAKWCLEVFQHGANLIAAPGGAGVNTKSLPGDPIGMLMGKVFMN